MSLDLTQLIICAIIGAIIGTIAGKIAPDACKRFHLFSIGKKALPLHLLSLVLFSACGILGIREQDYLMATVGFGMAVVSVLAIGIVFFYKNGTPPKDVIENHG